MNSTLRTVYMDVGGVVLTNAWDHAVRARAWAQFGLDPVKTEELHEQSVYALERGEMSLDDYLARILPLPPRHFSTDAFRDFMYAQSERRPEGLEVAGELAAGGRARLATLNNESLELNHFRIERFGLRRLFSTFCSSCYLGARKPGAEIFRRALGILHVMPGDAVFVDDREENLVMPRSIGIDSIHFVSAAQLRQEFVDRGLI